MAHVCEDRSHDEKMREKEREIIVLFLFIAPKQSDVTRGEEEEHDSTTIPLPSSSRSFDAEEDSMKAKY